MTSTKAEGRVTANADQIEYWNVVAGDKWVENQAKLDRLMAPLTEALLHVASPTEGESVLDVGCGCGTLTLALAEAVGSGGRIMGVDVSRPMLARAAARAEARPPGGGAEIELIRADAMVHTFEPVVDLLTSRFGVMFFEDKARAFANLRDAVKPMGRFCFLAWRARGDVEWMHLPLQWISPVLPMPESSDGTVGPFNLSDGEGTREMLADAGFRDVVADPLDRELVIGENVDDALSILLDAGPASRLLRDCEADDQRAAATRRLRQGLESHARPDGRVVMRGACWIYRGHL